jgi:tetratricopeptide (TPR) repeat protein
MKALLIMLACAACYDANPVRREHTALADNAGAIMAAATSAVPQEASKQQLFDQRYQAALGFYEQAKYPEAIAEFEAAYEVDPQVMLLFNIGQAYRKGGHLEEALAKYKEYLDKDPDAERAKVDDLVREIEKSLAKKGTRATRR